MQDNGFQNVKFEDLNEKVQEAVRQFANDYDITVLQYDSNQKVITTYDSTLDIAANQLGRI